MTTLVSAPQTLSDRKYEWHRRATTARTKELCLVRAEEDEWLESLVTDVLAVPPSQPPSVHEAQPPFCVHCGVSEFVCSLLPTTDPFPACCSHCTHTSAPESAPPRTLAAARKSLSDRKYNWQRRASSPRTKELCLVRAEEDEWLEHLFEGALTTPAPHPPTANEAQPPFCVHCGGSQYICSAVAATGAFPACCPDCTHTTTTT